MKVISVQITTETKIYYNVSIVIIILWTDTD